VRHRHVKELADFAAWSTVGSGLSYAGSWIAFRNIGVADWGLLVWALLLFGLGALAAVVALAIAVFVAQYNRSALPLLFILWNAGVLVTSICHLNEFFIYKSVPMNVPNADTPSDEFPDLRRP
jgi:hypothetical protein